MNALWPAGAPASGGGAGFGTEVVIERPGKGMRPAQPDRRRLTMPDYGSEFRSANDVTPLTWTELGETIRQLAGELGDEAGRDGGDVEDLRWFLASRVSMN
jgi:hypothetical protein